MIYINDIDIDEQQEKQHSRNRFAIDACVYHSMIESFESNLRVKPEC